MVGELYNYIANGSLLGILCSITIFIVLVSAILSVRQAYNQGKEIGLKEKDLKGVMTNSAVFSIIPTIPILMVYLMLMPLLGKYFPWLRLSVIGSGTYEYMVAEAAASSLGYTGLTDPGVNEVAFITIMWAATICISMGPLLTLFFNKSLDKVLIKFGENKNSFGAQISGAMFIGMLATFLMPKLLDYKNPLGIVSLIVAAGTALIINAIVEKTGKKILKDFGFPLSLVAGMIGSIIFSGIL